MTTRIALAAVLAAVLAAGCGATEPQPSATTAVPATTTAGWEVHSANCHRYELHQADTSTAHPVDAHQLTKDGCTPTNPDADTPWGDPVDERSWWVVPTSADRFEVTGTVTEPVPAAADTTPPGAAPVHITLAHHSVGDGCMTTEEYRGELVAIIEGPLGAPRPTIEQHKEPQPCD